MSPGYENRASKALEMLRMLHGEDRISVQAKATYALCHQLLIECDGDMYLAVARGRESGINFL